MTRLLLVLGLVALPVVASAQQAETIEYYGTDAIGSIRIVWDASGNVIARQDFTPFGEPVLQQGTAIPKEGFVGNESDAETNQDYFHARMFEARIGRFTRTDPIEDGVGEPQAWNRYAYGLNNPFLFRDATGLKADPCADTTYDSCVVGHAPNADPDWEGGYEPCPWYVCEGGGGSNASDSGDSSQDGGGGSSTQQTTTTTTTGTNTNTGDDNKDGTNNSSGQENPHARAQCAADAASQVSLAQLTGRTGYWGQTFLGNDVSAVSNALWGPNRAGAVGGIATSNPTPVNMISLTGKLIGNSVRWGRPSTEIGYNGAGTAFAKGFQKATLAQRLAKMGIPDALSLVSAVKLGWDVGSYAGAYFFICGK